MSLGLEDFDSLSKTSDHVGNLANVLSVLGGHATILHELTQNADDAQTATVVRFTVTDSELVAWNDGEFTACEEQSRSVCPWKAEGRKACDLHSFRTFAGRGKSEEADLSGAFGVGFTSVYQITDHPELVTGGYHLVLDESAEESRRITVCRDDSCGRDHGAPGTTFYLPWAKTLTDLRLALGAQVVADDDIAELESALLDRSPDAVLFLRRVEKIEVQTRSRSSVAHRHRNGNLVAILVNGRTASEWLFIEGEDESSQNLKMKFPQIDRNRSERVIVALPVGDTVDGRIYAGLPTQTRLGWSGHVDASFYPREDRKGVLFDDGTYRSDWNRDLIDTAAWLIQQNLEDVSGVIGLEATWALIRDVELAARPQSAYEEAFKPFFDRLKGNISDLQIMRTADGAVRAPRGCLVPQTEEEYIAESTLIDLGLPVVASALRPTVQSLSFTQYGMELLRATHLTSALIDGGLSEPWSPGEGRFSDAEMEALLATLEILLSRSKVAAGEAQPEKPAIVPCLDGRFAPAEMAVVIDEADQPLFVELGEGHIVDLPRLTTVCPSLIDLCPGLDVAIALEIVERAEPSSVATTADRLLTWFGNHQADLKGDSRTRAAALAIYPSSAGGLRPLEGLSLPSDFEDELGLADLVDRSRARGHDDLLRLLGARDLDAVHYLTTCVVPLAGGDIFDEAALDVILQVIHRARPQLDEDAGAAASVRGAALVRCTDGTVRKPAEVHMPNPAVELINPNAPIADASRLPEHLQGTLVWLGVETTPSRLLLSDAVQRLADDADDPDPDVVLSILDAVSGLPDRHPSVPNDLRNLHDLRWIPVKGGGRARPRDVYPTFREHLFASQGPKIGLPILTQQAHAKTLRWLGMPNDPPTSLIVAHLRHCAETKTQMHSEVYRELANSSDVQVVLELASEKCIQIAPGEFVEPDYVFWQETGLGRWVARLSPEQRRYQDFFDAVGVREQPEPAQLERLLGRLAHEYGNNRLDDEAQAVVHQAWTYLQGMLVGEDQEVSAVLRRLRKVRSVVDSRGLLNTPERLVFKDGRGLAERSGLLSQNVIRRERDTWRALDAAGVQPAETLIEAIPGDGERAHDSSLENLISDRRRPLIRVIESEFHNADEPVDAEALFRIQCFRVSDLTVKYRFSFANQLETTDPEPVHAIYLDDEDTLLFSDLNDLRRVARELARCVAGEDRPGLALQIDSVLRAHTVDDAEEGLNELGVADLSEVERVTAESGSVTSFDDESIPDEDAAGDAPMNEVGSQRDDATEDGEPEDADEESESGGRGDISDGAARMAGGDLKPGGVANAPGGGIGKSRTRSGDGGPSGSHTRGDRQEHMRSYVHYGKDDESQTVGDESPQDSMVDVAGVARVMEYERSCGRAPVEQAHSNPGFDVLSYGTDGTVLRRIEIKSLGGEWSLRGVMLSRRQYEESVAYPDEFWLYVVENAEDDDLCEIHRIKNPIASVGHFGFDDGWKVLREPDIERDDDGNPAMPSTKSIFLAWGAGSDG